MKLFFIDAKKLRYRFYIVSFSIVLIISTILVTANTIKTAEPVTTDPTVDRFIIAVDAGHGGYDPGVTLEELDEKDVNLAIALKLKEVLFLNGFEVVLTRDEDEDFLQTSGPKKQKDMAARKQIIEESGAHYLISIHANSIPGPKWTGAQVFYQSNREQSEQLGTLIQNQLKNDTQTTREAKPTDFYLTREIEIIGVVVEAGFLSNPGERAMLQDEKYQYTIAWSIAKGLIQFLEQNPSRPPLN
ncbi:N-acetylmuramoyl-L-alanine amidase [Alkalicella caledoniensis]|uniref:N-acetylmuramoyl-L-alanine amidase n=1 Tax=Alkalicella caledoniensis TaxID=2731377 RepID=A0A7G9W7T9_ALKCA|nr:N-acetylmuramoyl-L-alanine amidase [Alkalicella caledoniensis]QNO14751.1 N-acetylmuramoyl-L-alanine amidase [Alkalicella caledoniensis]